jgi:hypothetical protein
MRVRTHAQALLGALQVRTQKSQDYSGPAPFIVGENLEFLIDGGPPGAAISWSSWKNGQPTGENYSFYGQYLDNTGAADLAAGAVTLGDVGTWVKRVWVLGSDGQPTGEYADISFTIQEKTQPATRPSTPVWPPPNTAQPTIPARPGGTVETPPYIPIPTRPYETPIDPIFGTPVEHEPMPGRTPIYTAEPTTQEPTGPVLEPPLTQSPPIIEQPPASDSDSGLGLNSTFNIAGYEIPVWAIGAGVLVLLFMSGGRR